ncbi:hypothetical protein DMENIID0001_103790 [Sergentomyia squamirostris]
MPGNRRCCNFCRNEFTANGTHLRVHLTKCFLCPTSVRNFFIKEKILGKKHCEEKKRLRENRKEEERQFRIQERFKESPSSPPSESELEFLEEDVDLVFPPDPEKLPDDEDQIEYETLEEEPASDSINQQPRKIETIRDLLNAYLKTEKIKLELKEEKNEREKEEHNIRMEILKRKYELLKKRI